MPKPFLSFEEQLDKLATEKNLIIADREAATKVLQQISYFGLICGYKDIFKNPTTKKYKDNTAFEDIVALYAFDESLRSLFLKHLLHIERNVSSLLSYYFTKKYGENQSVYLNIENYDTVHNPKDEVQKLIGILYRHANTSAEHGFIVHQRNKHGNVPLWVLVNALTFGNISNMYRFLPQTLKTNIAKHFEKVNVNMLGKFFKVLTKFRNVCAHNERLYNHKTKDDIPDTVIHKKLNIPKKGNRYGCGTKDLFALVISFRYLLPQNEFLQFKSSLVKLINQFCTDNNIVTEAELLNKMGFPPNWKKVTLYRI
jgi:abortive infection bacteriophage resistance protein